MCVGLPYRIQRVLNPHGLNIKDRLRDGKNTKEDDNDRQERSIQKEKHVQTMTIELPIGYGGNTFHLLYDTTFEGGSAVSPIAWNKIRERFVSF